MNRNVHKLEGTANFHELAWTNRFEGPDRGRNMMPDVFVIVRNRADNQNGDFAACQVLLVPYVPINGNQDFIQLFCQRQQLTVFFATPTCIPDRFTKYPLSREQKFNLSGHALVQQKFHRRASARLIRASSSAAIASARVTLGKSSRNSFSVRPCSM